MERRVREGQRPGRPPLAGVDPVEVGREVGGRPVPRVLANAAPERTEGKVGGAADVADLGRRYYRDHPSLQGVLYMDKGNSP